MKKYVLDTSAILSFFQGDEGAGRTAEILKAYLSGQCEVWVSPIQFGEVYYITRRALGTPKAEEATRRLEEYGLVVPPIERWDAVAAGKLKVRTNLGFADCFAAELARAQGAVLVTADKDFRCVQKDIKVLWLGS